MTAKDLVVFLKDHKMPIPPQLEDRPVRIVVVDDEPAITEMIARAILAKHPEYEVHQAHDGFRAGSMVATLRPDAVILDLRMPGMDGFEVCRMIKAQDNTRQATVIAVTAYQSEESDRRIRECGAKTCLAKPLDLAELVGEVDAAVQVSKES
ncbi:hypothetical protein LCGC14_2150410 [marine sediment metagenome]|uniref:Response regulatory domain-containing protein n=1 Tax=marine sediment metagenome TaxID=412755 RepID=A0A0F9G8P9_9ZZZZ